MGSTPSTTDAETQVEFAPEQSYARLRKLIPSRLQPTIRGIRKRWERRRLKLGEPFFTVYPYTQMSASRQPRVLEVMQALDIKPSRLHAHRGWFHETFPHVVGTVDSLAMLHVDCDFYEPVLLTLQTWYPKLSPGGFVQIDDYEEFSGCHLATNEFLVAHPETRLETWGTFGRAIFLRKPVVGL